MTTASLVVAVAGAACTSGHTEPLPTPSPAASATAVPAPTAIPTPAGLLPRTWIDGLHGPHDGSALQIACLDASGDAHLDGADGNGLAGMEASLAADACADPGRHGEFFASSESDLAAFRCDAAAPPVHIVVIGGGGTDLLDPTSGVSLGLLDIRNSLYDGLDAAGIGSTTVVATAAIAGADLPQTRMERWLRLDLERRLLAMPCLRAVLIGHSHGGVVATSVLAAVEGQFPGRLYGVVLDRSTALYDRAASEMPSRAPLLNVFQLNEGWHGVPLAQPNIVNADESREVAPLEPRAAREPIVTVTHTNLDDSAGVQARIVGRVMAWLDPLP